MIVDDSVVMRKNLKALLTQGNHTVVYEASNGFQAYNEYADHMPDVVTMDITMPGINGIDAVKKIIKDFPSAKIIMISALDQRNMVFDALKNGAKHYIIKPVTAEKINSVIDRIMNNEDLSE